MVVTLRTRPSKDLPVLMSNHVWIGDPIIKKREEPTHYISPKRGNVLIIGDTHIPFEHGHYLGFCKKVRDTYKCDVVIHIGDEVDNHAISFHDTDPDGWSAQHEMENAIARLSLWYREFPEVDVRVGNHSALPFRKAYGYGIPRRMIKPYHELWQAPEGWTWHQSIEKDGVWYQHGDRGGKTPALNVAIEMGRPVVLGHHHTAAGVWWHRTHTSQIFGMNVGCGIDQYSYAMAYSKMNTKRPILGCGVVMDGGHNAMFVPMNVK